MSYVAQIDRPAGASREFPFTMSQPDQAPDFSGLEWSVIRLARLDGLWTIRSVGNLGRLWRWFIGRGHPQLANTRLEALRRISVLSWHFGFSVPGEDVAEFLSAGFSPEQYEMLVTSVRAASRPQLKVVGGEALA